MEGKKAAALCCLLIVLLSGHLQQVAAISKFCQCYQLCYPGCREHLPRWMCIPKCMDDCSPSADRVVAPSSTGDCDSICRSLSVCGSAAPGTFEVEACVNDCTENKGVGDYAPAATNRN